MSPALEEIAAPSKVPRITHVVCSLARSMTHGRTGWLYRSNALEAHSGVASCSFPLLAGLLPALGICACTGLPVPLASMAVGNRSSFDDVRYDNVQKYQDSTQHIGISFWAPLARDRLKTQGVLLTKGLEPGRSPQIIRQLKIHQPVSGSSGGSVYCRDEVVAHLHRDQGSFPQPTRHTVFWRSLPSVSIVDTKSLGDQRTGRRSFLVEESLGGYPRYRAGQLTRIWLRHCLLTVVRVHPLP